MIKKISDNEILLVCDECKKEYVIKSKYNVKYSKQKYGRDLCKSCKQKHQYKIGKREKQRNHIKELAAKTQKNKSYDERYGKEKSLLIKSKMSQASSGENNPNYGGQYSKWQNAHETRKGQTWEKTYGIMKATEMKRNMSNRVSGKNNPMYGKPSPIGSGNGWSGWYIGYYFRSLLELSFLLYLVENNIPFTSGENNKYKISYIYEGKNKTYFPDYFLYNTQEIIEIKPAKLINTKLNSAKYFAAKNKHGEKFKIYTEKNLQDLHMNIIYELVKCEKIIFIDRYCKKFKEYFNKENV